MIYLVRHGQTSANAEGRFQGQSDSPLTALGEAQARRVGERLRDVVGVDAAMVVSPLGRTRRTAEIIAEVMDHTGPLTFDPRITEVTMGSWDGMSGEDIDFVYPGARDGLSRVDWWFHSPNGETYGQFSGRVGGWLADALESPTPLIAVSHGGVSRVMRGLHLGIPVEEQLSLDVPQDAIFRFDGTTVEQIDC